MLPGTDLTIWIYYDEGVSELSMRSAYISFAQKLSLPSVNISIRTISSQEILDNQLQGRGCLIVPGGADLPYCKKLDGQGNKNIRQFVAQGNIYIGICAGGYYGARDIAFSGASYKIHGKRELAFFPGTAIGSIADITNGQLYDETTASKAIVQLDFKDAVKEELYYHGGAFFVSPHETSFRSIARYPNGSHAVISGEVGVGKYLLSGVHFELCADTYKEYAFRKAKLSEIMKEYNLLAVIENQHYGQAIFKEIETMIEQTILI